MMKKRKIFAAGLLLLLLLFALPSSQAAMSAEQTQTQAEEAWEFLIENDPILKLDKNYPYVLRNLYVIDVPAAQSLPVCEYYGAYEKVLLYEYGTYPIQTILASGFASVGFMADGEMALCPTPFDIISRTYDASIFDSTTITRIDLDEPSKK